MTLVLPTIANTNYGLTNTAFKNCKADRSGAVRAEYFTVAVPSSTGSGTVIGLVPFNKGFRFHQAGSIIAAGVIDTGTNSTVSLGFTYYDSTLGTSAGTAWVNAATTWQSSGAAHLTFLETETSVLTWVAAADGWITITTGTGSTTTTGNIFGQILGSYDIGG